jgi:hypothetical protein
VQVNSFSAYLTTYSNIENFNEDFNNLLKKKSSNTSFFTKLKYDQLILHINQLKNNLKKKEPNDYKLLKKYNMLKVSDVNKLTVPVSENNEIKYYVYNEELFDVIHNVHLSIGHGGRYKMEHEVNTKYKNITRNMIMLKMFKHTMFITNRPNIYKN